MGYRKQRTRRWQKSSFPAIEARASGAKPEQEVELWWGAYSSWTMTPSLVFCLSMTAVIVAVAIAFFERWLKFAILIPSVAMWLIEGSRWAYRVFGYNYLLTTHRLVKDWGVLHKCWVEVNLARVSRVEVRRKRQEFIGGVGRVVIFVEGEKPVVLHGVRQPSHVAERIRQQVHLAREANVAETPAVSTGCSPEGQK